MFSLCKKKSKPTERKLRWFKESEFACPCCGALPAGSLMIWADDVRSFLNKPMKINSGKRCEKHNKKVGGVSTSQHVEGLAIDVHCPNETYKKELIEAMEANGVRGLGEYATFIHGDIRHGKKARWKG